MYSPETLFNSLRAPTNILWVPFLLAVTDEIFLRARVIVADLNTEMASFAFLGKGPHLYYSRDREAGADVVLLV